MFKIYRNQEQEVLKQNEKNGVEYLTFPSLTNTGVVNHLFSTRLGGVSTGIFSSMNYSFTRGDNKEAVLENYRRTADVLGCALEDFVCSDQTHTTNIRRITQADRGKGVVKPGDYTDVDGMITDEENIVLATFYADCVPLFFVDSRHRAIGLAHSGWKGTVHKMGQCMIERMAFEYGTRPEDLQVAIGPSICQECYEVSEDVAEQFKQAFPDSLIQSQIMYSKMKEEETKYQLNLQKANYFIFKEAGISDSQIAVTDICTAHNPDYLFSHRASHGKRGNLGAFMTLRKY